MLDISVKSIFQKISQRENNFTRMLVKICLVSEWIKDEGDGYQIDSYGGLKVLGYWVYDYLSGQLKYWAHVFLTTIIKQTNRNEYLLYSDLSLELQWYMLIAILIHPFACLSDNSHLMSSEQNSWFAHLHLSVPRFLHCNSVSPSTHPGQATVTSYLDSNRLLPGLFAHPLALLPATFHTMPECLKNMYLFQNECQASSKAFGT